MLWMVLAPAVPTKAQPTAWMDITVAVSTDTPIYLPMNFTVPYMLQLVDPSSGMINILYPNKMLNISDQQLVTIGSYSVDSTSNKITFWTGVNITAAGNYTYNFRLIYDSVLMANNTIDTSLHVYTAFPWMYGVPITIGNASSALTDYQINLYLNLSSQVSAGKIRSDLGDLRFNDSSGNALSYWIEDPTASAAKIWVNVTSIPASPSTATIYMYYGNPSATSQSNGGNTFVFFDDFSGSSLDSTKWTLNRWYGSGSYSATVANGYVEIYSGATTAAGIVAKTGVSFPFAVEGRYRIVAGSENWHAITQTSSGTDSDWVRVGYSATYFYYQKKVSGTISTYQYFSRTLPTSWTRISIIWTSSSAQYFENGAQVNTVTTQDRFTSGTNYLQLSTWDGGKSDYDWIAIRNYVNPEPTYSVGSEQQLVSYAYSVSYGQLSTESQLTVRIPTFSPVQTFTANVSGSFTAPTPLPDAIKIIYNMEYGRYALALLPLLFMLVAGKHYAGIMGILACGMSALINVTVGVALFDWTVLGIIAFVCILLIFTEGG